ncbi:unnamed protein product, partial [Protopolystoma xenopodis]
TAPPPDWPVVTASPVGIGRLCKQYLASITEKEEEEKEEMKREEEEGEEGEEREAGGSRLRVTFSKRPAASDFGSKGVWSDEGIGKIKRPVDRTKGTTSRTGSPTPASEPLARLPLLDRFCLERGGATFALAGNSVSSTCFGKKKMVLLTVQENLITDRAFRLVGG